MTILILIKRPIILMLAHLVAAVTIIVRNERLVGNVSMTEYAIFLIPVGLVALLWSWWVFENRTWAERRRSAE